MNKQRITALYKEHKTDLFLYIGSGLLAFITDYATLQVTDSATHNLLAATAAGILAGFVVSYVLNHIRFQKRHEASRAPKESFPLFAGLFVFNTLFTFLCLDYNDKHVQLPRLIVKAATVGCIMVWNYLLFHMVVFRKTTNST